jgi:hypothetical protein
MLSLWVSVLSAPVRKGMAEKIVPFLVHEMRMARCAQVMVNVILQANVFVPLALLDRAARPGAQVQQRLQLHHAMKMENARLIQQLDELNVPATRDS